METLEKQLSQAIRLQRAAVTGTLTTILELQKAGAGVVPQSLEKITWIPKDGINTVSSMLRIGSKTTEDMTQLMDRMYSDLEKMVTPAAVQSKKTSSVSEEKTSVSRPEMKEAQSEGAATKVRQKRKTATPVKKSAPTEKKQTAASKRKSSTAGNTTKQKKTATATRSKKGL